MATPRRRSHAAQRAPRIPSDEELERLRAILHYGRAMAIAKRAGVAGLHLPDQHRVRHAAPLADQQQRDKVMARMDAIIEERIKARLEAHGIPYTEERPYRHWVEPKKRRATTPPAARRTLDAFDPCI